VAVLLGLAVALNYGVHWAAPINRPDSSGDYRHRERLSVARRVIKMNIAIMERSMMEIAMAASLIILGLQYCDRWWLRVRRDQ